MLVAGGIIGGGGGGIKSIQVGSISLVTAATNTAAITAVDLANSILIPLGNSLTTGGSADVFARLDLTSNILVTATRIGTSGTLTCPFMVVEYYPGVIKSIQNISITVANGSVTNTQAVTAVVVANSFIVPLGHSVTDNASGNGSNWAGTLALTSTVLVTATRGASVGANVYNGLLVEYY